MIHPDAFEASCRKMDMHCACSNCASSVAWIAFLKLWERNLCSVLAKTIAVCNSCRCLASASCTFIRCIWAGIGTQPILNILCFGLPQKRRLYEAIVGQRNPMEQNLIFAICCTRSDIAFAVPCPMEFSESLQCSVGQHVPAQKLSLSLLLDRAVKTRKAGDRLA